jgi:hypothetical protein
MSYYTVIEDLKVDTQPLSYRGPGEAGSTGFMFFKDWPTLLVFAYLIIVFVTYYFYSRARDNEVINALI